MIVVKLAIYSLDYKYIAFSFAIWTFKHKLTTSTQRINYGKT